MSFDFSEAIKQSNANVKELGYEPRALQYKWRTDPPETYNSREATLAIIEALVHEGVLAWNGDAVSCVEQMLRCLHELWIDALLAEREAWRQTDSMREKLEAMKADRDEWKAQHDNALASWRTDVTHLLKRFAPEVNEEAEARFEKLLAAQREKNK